MHQNDTDTFLSYWHSLQTQASEAPLRKLFDPANLKPVVSQMLMIGSSATQYRFRLSGGFLVKLHGRELKELSLLSLFHPAYHQGVRTALMMGARQQHPIVLSIKGHTSRHEDFTMDIILAPLREAGGEIERMVGLYVPTSDMPHMTGQTIERFNLISTEVLQPDELPVFRPVVGVNAKGLTPRLVSIEGQRLA